MASWSATRSPRYSDASGSSIIILNGKPAIWICPTCALLAEVVIRKSDSRPGRAVKFTTVVAPLAAMVAPSAATRLKYWPSRLTEICSM